MKTETLPFQNLGPVYFIFLLFFAIYLKLQSVAFWGLKLSKIHTVFKTICLP